MVQRSRPDNKTLLRLWKDYRLRDQMEARNALIGFDAMLRLLYVVHIDNDDDGHIRLISARPATAQERKIYGDI